MPYLHEPILVPSAPLEEFNRLEMARVQVQSPARSWTATESPHLTIEGVRSTGEDEAMEATPALVKDSSSSSRPPTPPESGAGTPRLSIQPYPARLTPMLPPKNFGTVEIGTIFRSAFPEKHNIEFLEQLDLKTIVTLVETEANPEFDEFVKDNGIQHRTIPIIANKGGEIRTQPDSLCEAVLFAMHPEHHPVYIHCNRGKHRTGCVVACIRRIQQWPLVDILAEYDTYASPKARKEDIELIKAFDPAMVYEYAKKNDMLDCWPRDTRVDSANDIWELAASLPSHSMSVSTNASDYSPDEALVMGRPGLDLDPGAQHDLANKIEQVYQQQVQLDSIRDAGRGRSGTGAGVTIVEVENEHGTDVTVLEVDDEQGV